MSETQRHFHEELADVRARLLTMSGAAEAALELAIEALIGRNEEKAQAVILGDRAIDDREVDIEQRCLALLARHQPMARDLRLLIAAMRIANDLERVGDHAVNIAQSATRLPKSAPRMPEREIGEMARLTRLMLSDAMDAFVRSDAAAGREICVRDDEVDALNRSIYKILLMRMMEDVQVVSSGMEILLVSRNLERVADLATNVAEGVVFLAEGKSIKHHAEDGGVPAR
ncbi:MAG: phosphate signaling complex protein PhoU [Gemmatimonadaceae bacterium]